MGPPMSENQLKKSLSRVTSPFLPRLGEGALHKCFSDSNGLQCAELSIPVGHLAGEDLFHLHFEAGDWGIAIYVGP